MPTDISPNAVILRVGTRIGSTDALDGGAAAMASFNLTINENQFRYRIRVLGIANIVPGINSGFSKHRSYNFNPPNNPGFGYFVQTNITTNYQIGNNGFNKIIGMNEFGYYRPGTTLNNFNYSTIGLDNQYPLFDRKWQISNQLVQIGGSDRFRTNGWQEQILDFRRFVNQSTDNLSADTQMRLSLITHSNTNSNANRHAYAYYIIEQLNDVPYSTPPSLIFNSTQVNNITDCNSENDLLVDLPVPDYINQMNNSASNFHDRPVNEWPWLNSNRNNFAKFSLEMENPSGVFQSINSGSPTNPNAYSITNTAGYGKKIVYSLTCNSPYYQESDIMNNNELIARQRFYRFRLTYETLQGSQTIIIERTKCFEVEDFTDISQETSISYIEPTYPANCPIFPDGTNIVYLNSCDGSISYNQDYIVSMCLQNFINANLLDNSFSYNFLIQGSPTALSYNPSSGVLTVNTQNIIPQNHNSCRVVKIDFVYSGQRITNTILFSTTTITGKKVCSDIIIQNSETQYYNPPGVFTSNPVLFHDRSGSTRENFIINRNLRRTTFQTTPSLSDICYNEQINFNFVGPRFTLCNTTNPHNQNIPALTTVNYQFFAQEIISGNLGPIFPISNVQALTGVALNSIFNFNPTFSSPLLLPNRSYRISIIFNLDYGNDCLVEINYKPNNFDIHIKSSAFAGQIAIDNYCTPIAIISNPDFATPLAGGVWENYTVGGVPSAPGNTNNPQGLYAWEILNGTNWQLVTNANSNLVNQETILITTIQAYAMANGLPQNGPWVIRRVASGYQECSAPNFSTSNIFSVPANVNPIFDFPTTFCQNETSFVLPLTSNPNAGGYTTNGTWSLNGSPVSSINTNTAGVFYYIFTPNSDNCAFPVTIEVTILPSPIFNGLSQQICQNEVVLLPNTSTNDIIGNWSFNGTNVTQINSSTVGSFTYTFTPHNNPIGQENCILIFNVEILNTPVFNLPNILCEGETPFTLPTLSNNGIAGSWTPSTVSNTTSANYVFTPQNSSCIANHQVNITNGELPIFDLPNIACIYSNVPTLPTTSNNGINGTWSPLTINNTVAGTQNFVFTPNANSCSTPVEFEFTILPLPCGFQLNPGSEVSCQEGENPRPDKPDFNNIADGPCLRVCENSTIEYTINTHLGSSGFTTQWLVTGGSINTATQTDSYCEITWDNIATVGIVQAIITLSATGQIHTITRCIEKLAAPIANFNFLPNGDTFCNNTPLYVQNTSSSNNGHDDLYYNWYIDDELFSSEFEPIFNLSSGIYKIKLVVFNGCSCSNEIEFEIKIIENKITIDCPSLVCENVLTNYTINGFDLSSDPNCITAQGGEIVNINGNEFQINWNNVDSTGFGYIHFNCGNCPITVKIPVVQSQGTIVGDNAMCWDSQGTYKLPQWPTTEIEWELIDIGDTGAANLCELIITPQRNEIILESGNISGLIRLKASYRNTLLNCTGEAYIDVMIKPNLIISGPSTVCQGDTITFGHNALSPVHFSVIGPNNFLQEINDVSIFDITFSEIGTYIIAANDLSDYCPSTLTVEVLPSPNITPQITGTEFFCATTPASYTCEAPSGYQTAWSVTGGQIVGVTLGNNVQVNFDGAFAGTHQVHAQFIAANGGCISETASFDVFPNQITIIPHNWDLNPCPSSQATYTFDTIDSFGNAITQGASYEWSVIPANAGSVGNTNNNSVTVNWHHIPGATAQLQVRYNFCGSEETIIIPQTFTLQPIPNLNINLPNEICVGVPMDLNILNTSGNAITYTSIEWDFGNGDTLTQNFGAPASYTYQNPLHQQTNYNISAVITGLNGCLTATATLNHSITVSPSPVFTLSPASLSILYCGGVPVPEITLNIQTGFGTTTNIEWHHIDENGTDVIISNGLNPTISVFDPGNNIHFYYAIVTNEFGCQTRSQNVNVHCGSSQYCPTNEQFAELPSSLCPQEITFLAPVNLPPGFTNVFWGGYHNTEILLNSPTQFVFNALQPGPYKIKHVAVYPEGHPNYCQFHTTYEFLVPYIPNFKWEVTSCQNNQYQVQLFNHTEVYPLIGDAPDYDMTIQYIINGTTYLASVTQPFIIPNTLAPGSHQITIRVSHPNYPTCEFTDTITLEPMPNATFTINGNCQNQPITFELSNPLPEGSTLMWNFNDLDNTASTFAPATVFVYQNGETNISPSVTVTNRYGCSVTQSLPLFLLQNFMRGTISVSPVSVCEGTPIEISYEPSQSTQPPGSFSWFRDGVFLSTTNAPQITVTQSGVYRVHLHTLPNSGGCTDVMTPEILVTYHTPPDAPVINGPVAACFGESVTFNVIAVPSLHYEWAVNGTHDPAFDGFASISLSELAAGINTITVTPFIIDSQGNHCAGVSSSHTIEIADEVPLPQIQIDLVVCEPYYVEVSVANPQPNTNYYWSNGAVGTSTTMTHGGPIQVRAEFGGCENKSQIDLPKDLNALAWVFPKGCFDICEQWLSSENSPYLVGPHGYFDSPGGWRWSNYAANNHWDGTGLVPNYYITESGKFGQTLAEDNCSIEINTATINFKACDDCAFKDLKVFDYQCISQNGQIQYYLNTFIHTGFNTTVPIYIELVDPSLGTLTPNPFMALPGLNAFNLVFTPYDASVAHSLLIRFWAMSPETGLLCEYYVEMRVDCTERPFIADCELKALFIDHSSVQCIGTPTSPAYQMEVYMETGLDLNMNYIFEESNGWGIFSPNSFTVVPGGVWFTLTYVPTTPSNSITLIVRGFNGELELCQARTRTRLPECRRPRADYKTDVALNVQPTINLYPNPANDWAVLDYHFTASQDRQIQLIDLFGRVIATHTTHEKDGIWHIDLSAFANGLYVVNIMEQNQTIKSIKLLKK